jgi:hypothetical protein
VVARGVLTSPEFVASEVTFTSCIENTTDTGLYQQLCGPPGLGPPVRVIWDARRLIRSRDGPDTRLLNPERFVCWSRHPSTSYRRSASSAGATTSASGCVRLFKSDTRAVRGHLIVRQPRCTVLPFGPSVCDSRLAKQSAGGKSLLSHHAFAASEVAKG